MKTINEIKAQILRLSGAQVTGAYVATCNNVVGSLNKLQQAEWLAQQVHCGTIVFDQIANPAWKPELPTQITAAVQAAVPAPQDDRKIKELEALVSNLGQQLTVMQQATNNAIAGHAHQLKNLPAAINGAATVANRADQAALESISRIAKLDDRSNAIEEQIKKVEAIKQEVIKQADIDQQVTDAIASAFKPFKEAVETAGLQQVVGELVDVRVIDRNSCEDVFGVKVIDSKGDPVMVELWNDPTAPAIDPCFIWTKEILQVLLLAQDTGICTWLGGDKGTGKTMSLIMWAAYTGRSMFRINHQKHSSVEELVGSVGLDSTGTVFKPGDFLKGYTRPGAVILLDEVTTAQPDVLAIYHGFLEPHAAVNFGGSVWRKAFGVMLSAADNSTGNGDSTGRHSGLKTMNSAFMDRFSLIVPFTFLPKNVEVQALIKHTGCTEILAGHVVDAIAACRAKVKSGDIIDAPSIRSAIAFILACKRLDVDTAWNMTVASRQPDESAPAVLAIYKACINPRLITEQINL